MTIRIRHGSALDVRSATRLLNEIINVGGTTALTKEVTKDEMEGWLFGDAGRTAWHVAVDDHDRVQGFQWIGPWPDLPPEACEIGTFVKIGQTGLGIGSQLFEATKSAALDLGFDWINANIRSDNESGLTYYQSRGFRTYRHEENVTLPSGQTVGKTHKRYDLKD